MSMRQRGKMYAMAMLLLCSLCVAAHAAGEEICAYVAFAQERVLALDGQAWISRPVGQGEPAIMPVAQASIPLPDGGELALHALPIDVRGARMQVFDLGERWALTALGGAQDACLVMDKESGRTTVTELHHVSEVCAYRDGRLLLTRHEDGVHCTVSVFDPLRLEEATLISSELLEPRGLPNDMRGLVYDAQEDRLCYLVGNSLRARDASGKEQVLLAVEGLPEGPLAAHLYADTYAVYAQGALYSFSRAAQQRTLRIRGKADPDFIAVFMEEHPEIKVEQTGYVLDEVEQLHADLMSGQEGADIYALDFDIGLRSFIERGYFMDLSKCEPIARAVGTYYDEIQEALRFADGIYALPSEMRYETYLVETERWRELGYGELPRTYGELLALMDEHALAEHPPLAEEPIFLAYTMLSRYLLLYAKTEEPIDFNTEVFRDCMQRCKALEGRYAAHDAPLTVINPYCLENLDGLSLSIVQETIPPFGFMEEDPPLIEAQLHAYVINAATENPDLAMEFLTSWLAYQSVELQIMLSPRMNTPVESGHYRNSVSSLTDTLADIEMRLQTEADELIRKDLLDAGAGIQLALDGLERERWRISEDSIGHYRRMAEGNLVVSSGLYGASTGSESLEQQLQNLVLRYMQDELTLDAFIREMNRKAQMAFLEHMG